MAVPLSFSTSFDVTTGSSGGPKPQPDPLMLGGTRFTIDTVFADLATFGNPTNRTEVRVLAESSTLTVVGGGSTRTFAFKNPIGLFAGRDAANSGFRSDVFSFLGAGPLSVDGFGSNSLQLDANGLANTAAGTKLTLGFLNGLTFGPQIGFNSFSTTGSGGTSYRLSNFSTSASEIAASPVPLPAGLPLLLAGLAGLGALRARRKRIA